jgi:hypothetical protein
MQNITVLEKVDGEMIENVYTPELLKNVKLGEFLTLRPGGSIKYVRGAYDQSAKKYQIDAWNKGTDKLLKSNEIVYINFTY